MCSVVTLAVVSFRYQSSRVSVLTLNAVSSLSKRLHAAAAVETRRLMQILASLPETSLTTVAKQRDNREITDYKWLDVVNVVNCKTRDAKL